MNLIIDIGNSRAKLAVFHNGEMLTSLVCPKENLKTSQNELLKKFPEIKDGILANVAAPRRELQHILEDLAGKTITLSSKTQVPFNSAYKTPETLGLDRIALAAATVSGFPHKNALVIDAGTCVTYDIITAEATYLGGAISPGLSMRFRALNNFTARLPLLTPEPGDLQSLGQTTPESLQLGVTQGLVFEIEGFIAHFQRQFKDLTIILTGGNCEFLSKRLKNSIFAPENFLLSGLNCILEYNKH